MGFEFGKGHLVGIEVRAIGRQEEEPGASGALLGIYTALRPNAFQFERRSIAGGK